MIASSRRRASQARTACRRTRILALSGRRRLSSESNSSLPTSSDRSDVSSSLSTSNLSFLPSFSSAISLHSPIIPCWYKKTLYSQVFLDQFGKSPKNSEKGERSNGGNWAQASSPHRWLAWQDQDGPGGKRTSYKSVCLLGTSRSERIARCSSKQLCAHAAAVLAQRWQPHNSGGAATWQR